MEKLLTHSIRTLIICYRMEKLLTLHYGNFSILGEWVKEFAQRTGCSNWVADWTLCSQLFLDEIRREHLGWSATHKQEWGLFLLKSMLHNAASMWRKEHWRHSQALQPTQVTAPEHPSMGTLLGSLNTEILKVAEQVQRGKCAMAPSILPCRQQDECLRELYQELTKCMASTGLQVRSSLARPTARSRRYSNSHSISWACSPSAWPWGMEAAKWLKEDTPAGQSGSRRNSHSKRRDRSRLHQSPLLITQAATVTLP